MQLDYEKAVNEALTEPGRVSAAYSAFWHYSLGNQMLAMWQLGRAEPINTYPGWQKLGRQVVKGQRGIVLLMPVARTKKDEQTGEASTRTFFIERRNWFGLSQTEGKEYAPEPIPNFDMERSLAKLEITKRPFEIVDGNTQGYAIPNKRVIAVSSIAFDPTRTQIHETAHVLLHGNEGKLLDGERPERAIREVEAELTVYLVKASLGITAGLELSRGYIQSWLGDTSAEKVRFSAVFRAVDGILKAGRPEEPTRPNPQATAEEPKPVI